jgi:alpha-tubulin suppressor-like RCC1 family protein
MQRMGASRSAQSVIGAQWRLAPTADAERWPKQHMPKFHLCAALSTFGAQKQLPMNKSILLLSLFSWLLSVQSGSAATQVIAWGWNGYGQLNVPSGLTNVTAISAGQGTTLALNADGTLVQWGSINYDPTHQVPASLRAPRAISSGSDPFNLALKTDGTVVGWGGNDYGCSSPPAGLNGVIAIAAGYVHSLALRSDGTVVAWGDNSEGQTKVPSWLSNVVAVAAGEFHSLALRSDGTVVGWGSNYDGEATGTPTITPSGTNGVVTRNGQVLTGVVAIVAGNGRFSLGVRRDGTLVQWGSTSFTGGAPPSNVSNVVAVAAGTSYVLALKRDGTVTGWGIDMSGETRPPEGLTGVVAIDAAPAGPSFALVAGDDFPRVAVSAPQKSPNSFTLSVSAEANHVYALEYTDSLLGNAWTSLPLAAGNGANLTLADTNPSTSARFYRVRRW